MKNLLFALLFCAVVTSSADVKKDDNGDYIATTSSIKSDPTATTKTYTDNSGTYPIYLSASGRAYIVKVSAKSGKEYKKYLGEEISRELCEIYGIEYKELKK